MAAVKAKEKEMKEEKEMERKVRNKPAEVREIWRRSDTNKRPIGEDRTHQGQARGQGGEGAV